MCTCFDWASILHATIGGWVGLTHFRKEGRWREGEGVVFFHLSLRNLIKPPSFFSPEEDEKRKKRRSPNCAHKVLAHRSKFFIPVLLKWIIWQLCSKVVARWAFSLPPPPPQSRTKINNRITFFPFPLFSLKESPPDSISRHRFVGGQKGGVGGEEGRRKNWHWNGIRAQIIGGMRNGGRNWTSGHGEKGGRGRAKQSNK